MILIKDSKGPIHRSSGVFFWSNFYFKKSSCAFMRTYVNLFMQTNVQRIEGV